MSWRKPRMLQAGAPAPEFELRDLSGTTKSLRDILAQGPAVLALFKVSCPVCQMTLPYLERLSGGIQIIGISQDDARATREFNEEFGITFPVLLDAKGYPVSDAFGISAVPSLFVVEPDGTVSASGDGFSKREIEAIAGRAGAAAFRPGERVPDWRPG